MAKTYAEAIYDDLKDKTVEMLIGESYEELSLDQMTSHYPAVIVGKVVNAIGQTLVLDCLYVRNRKAVFGKRVYINDFCIKLISEVDDKCVLEDLLLRGRDTRSINKMQEKDEFK